MMCATTSQLKPAPIQVSFPVYPGTSGASVIDYRIMDRYFAPRGAEAYLALAREVLERSAATAA